MKQIISIIVVLLQYIVENIYSLLGHSTARGATMSHIRAIESTPMGVRGDSSDKGVIKN